MKREVEELVPCSYVYSQQYLFFESWLADGAHIPLYCRSCIALTHRVRPYFEQLFVVYNWQSRLISLEEGRTCNIVDYITSLRIYSTRDFTSEWKFFVFTWWKELKHQIMDIYCLSCNSVIWWPDVFLFFVYWAAIRLESLDSLSSTSRTAGIRWFSFDRPILWLFALAYCSCPKKHCHEEGKDPCRHSIHERFFSHKVAWMNVEDKVFLFCNYMIIPLGYCS